MDAYDHIQEEAMSPSTEKDDKEGALADATQEQSPTRQSGDLKTEFREAYQALSSTPWCARLGSLWGQVKKQVWLFDISVVPEALTDLPLTYRANPIMKAPVGSSP